MLQSGHTDSAAAAQRWQDITEIWDFIMLQGIILRRQECATHIAIYIIRQTMQIMSLNILERALNDKTPEYSVKQMQEILDKNEVEPGPDSKTIGIIYRVGELMMNDKDYRLARDCFSIVYDITQETQLKTLLDELDKDLEADNA